MDAIRTSDAGQGETRNDERPGRDALGRRTRRVFRPEYKLAILAEYDRCGHTAARNELLRREGLYSSLLTDWRRQKRLGTLVTAKGRSGKGRTADSKHAAENKALKKRVAQLEAELETQRKVAEIQGKVHGLLEDLSKSLEEDEQ
jgi:transposase-like protein